MSKVLFFQLCVFIIISSKINAFSQQNYTISGKVKDELTGEGVPFATVSLKGKQIATYTDFEGNYQLISKVISDSIMVSFVGYLPKTKALGTEFEQVINFQLSSQVLKEIVVYARRENPAYRILKEVDKNKSKNDYAKLNAYQYDSYNHIGISVRNLSKSFKRKKIIRDIYDKIKAIEQLKDSEDANIIIPLFVSETSSSIYFRKSPTMMKEDIHKTHIKGLGLTDDSFMAQLTNSGYNSINFYQPWVGLFKKEIMSPIVKQGNGFYNYYLKDTVQVGLYNCYAIDFDPKNKYDLAFRGTAWIDTTSHALVQIEANLDKTANINFIDNVKIQQEYEYLGNNEDVWMPEKTRLVLSASGLFDETTGAVISLNKSIKNVVANQAKPVSFFENTIELAEDRNSGGEEFWKKTRDEKMTKDEQLAFDLIDTLNQIPSFKRLSNTINYFINGGYFKLNSKINFGSTFFTYSYNNIEHNRLRVGIRTSPQFSKRLDIRAFVAYGTYDKVYKGGGEIYYTFPNASATRLGLFAKMDIDQIGIRQDEIGNNPLFQVISYFGKLRGAFFKRDYTLSVQQKFMQNFNETVTIRYRKFLPLTHYDDLNLFENEQQSILTNFTNPEISFETSYIPNRLFTKNPNRIKIRAGTSKPVISFKYTYGLIKDGELVKNKEKLGNYHIFEANFSHVLHLGKVGKTEYNIQGFYTPSLLPLTQLKAPLGNQTLIYANNAFNMMQFSEFASDKSISLSLFHSFEGLLTNRLPLINRWNLRTFALGKVLYGSMRDENFNLLSEYVENRPKKPSIYQPASLGDIPYVEVGYGVDNIFRLLRVAAIHRLTHLNSPAAKSFGIRLGIKLSL